MSTLPGTRKRPPSKPAKGNGALAAHTTIKLTQNQHTFYITTIKIEDLFPYCFVSSRHEDPVNGFQRLLNQQRAEEIAKYLSNSDGSIPTCIVLSAQSEAQLKWVNNSKKITFKNIPRAFLVIDGQHRLWGYHICLEKYEKSLRVPVAIYSGLDRATEAKLFVDINTTQKGVTASLLLDIQQLAGRDNDTDRELRSLFDQLAKDHRSPLRLRMSPSKSAPGRISRVTFKKALAGVLTGGALASLNGDERYTLLLNYLLAMDAELSAPNAKKLLFSASFFEALFDVFDNVIEYTLAKQGNLKQASIQETIRPIARIDYSNTKGTKGNYVFLMKSALRSSRRISGDIL